MAMDSESPVFLAVIRLMALAIAVVFHEVAHGYVAWRLGDPTARQAQRLTLNPFAHVDLVGSVILPMVLIFTGSPVLLGWAKPVPFNPGFFRNPRKGIMLVAFAGPATNLLLALASGLLFRLVLVLGSGGAAIILLMGLAYLCITNVVLGVFNLIPIPPLDGSKIVMGLLPESLARAYAGVERFGFLLIFGLLYLGALDYLIRPAAGLLMRLFMGPL
jgi:Zn-dependent protease